MTKTRYPYIDIARGISITLLVLGHTLGYSEHSKLVYKLIYSFVVPLFFLVSGYVSNMKSSIKEFIRGRFIRIVVPYFIWGLLFLIPYLMMGNTTADSLNMTAENDALVLIRNVLYGIGKDGALRHNSTLWFLPALFTIEVTDCFVILCVNKLKKPLFEIVALAILIIIGYSSSKYLVVDLPWGINTMLVAGPYFYVGYLLRKHDLISKLATLKYRKVIEVSLLAIWFITAYSNSLLAFMSYSYGNMVLGYLSGMSMSILLITLSMRIRTSRVLELVGRNTMSVMLFHKLVVLIFQTKAGEITRWLKHSNIIVEIALSMVITIIAIACSLVAATILRKLFPFAIGEVRREKKTITWRGEKK